MGHITIPVWPEGSSMMFAKDSDEIMPTAIFQTKVIEVPDIKVEWLPAVSFQGNYRVSILYRHQVYHFSFTPEAIPDKATALMPWVRHMGETLQKMAYIDEEAMPWFQQELLGKCFPNEKPLDWPEMQPKPNFQGMAQELPGLDQKVSCPRCGKARRKTPLGDVIIHLNDRHKMTRENIAKWLDDEADAGRINIDFQTPEERERKKNEHPREENTGSKDVAAAYELLKSGHLTKEEFDELIDDFKNSPLGVWDNPTDGSGSGETDDFPSL